MKRPNIVEGKGFEDTYMDPQNRGGLVRNPSILFSIDEGPFQGILRPNLGELDVTIPYYFGVPLSGIDGFWDESAEREIRILATSRNWTCLEWRMTLRDLRNLLDGEGSFDDFKVEPTDIAGAKEEVQEVEIQWEDPIEGWMETRATTSPVVIIRGDVRVIANDAGIIVERFDPEDEEKTALSSCWDDYNDLVTPLEELVPEIMRRNSDG